MKKAIDKSAPPAGQEAIDSERRALVLGALATLPATALLAACGSAAWQGDELEPELSGSSSAELRCRELVSAHERKRRRQLVGRHVGEENEHDIDGVMRTFARQSEASVNGFVVTDREGIRLGHIGGGFSDEDPGAFEGIRVVPEIEYITDDEIVFEGYLVGTHVAPSAGFPPTFREVTQHYVAFYRFDQAGKLVSERLVINTGPLAPLPTG